MPITYTSALKARTAQLRTSVSQIPFVAFFYCASCQLPHFLGALTCPHCGEPPAQREAA